MPMSVCFYVKSDSFHHDEDDPVRAPQNVWVAENKLLEAGAQDLSWDVGDWIVQGHVDLPNVRELVETCAEHDWQLTVVGFST